MTVLQFRLLCIAGIIAILSFIGHVDGCVRDPAKQYFSCEPFLIR